MTETIHILILPNTYIDPNLPKSLIAVCSFVANIFCFPLICDCIQFQKVKLFLSDLQMWWHFRTKVIYSSDGKHLSLDLVQVNMTEKEGKK